MSELRIRVGAALDSDTSRVFIPLIQAAERARIQIRNELNAAAKETEEGLKVSEDKKVNVLKKTAALAMSTAKQVADMEVRETQRAEREKEQSYKRLTGELDREVRKREQSEVSAKKRAAAEAARAERSANAPGARYARQVGYWSMRNLSPTVPTLSLAKRIGGDLLRGAGVNTDVSSMISSYVSRQKLAADITNSGYIAGAAGANGQRQDSGGLMAQASKVASDTALDPTKALEGIKSFVSQTGDLETARAIFGDLAKLSRATGTNLETMIDASAAVSNQLGDIPDKAARINDIMRAVAGEGKLGAMEIRDFATQMAKVAAAAPQFAGDTGQSIKLMGALAQEARMHGGAPNAATAATSVMSFMNTFSKGARVKSFAAEGINVFDKSGKIASPEAIILAALQKTGGDNLRMGKLFQDVRARTVTRGFENIYRDAGGGQEGLKAVDKEFKRLLGAQMSVEEVDRSFALSMQTAEAKAQRFQNKLQEIADKTAEKLLPAMEKLAPAAERAAGMFANLLLEATEHPGQAIALAISASIAKAGLENLFRMGVEKMFDVKSSAGGKLASSMLIASLAVTAMTVGMAYIDNLYETKAAGQRKEIANNISADNASGVVSSQGFVTEQQKADLEKQLATLQAQYEKKREAVGSASDSPVEKLFAGITQMVAPGAASDAVAQQYQEQVREMRMTRDSMQKVATILQNIQTGGIPVRTSSGPVPPTGAAIAPSTATAGPNPQHR